MPGEFSNEIAVKASGDNIAGPAKGFKAGVLSTQKASSGTDLKFQPITKAEPQRTVTEAGNIFTRFISLLTHLFNR